MERESHIEYDQTRYGHLRFTSFVLPTDEYDTFAVNFPGGNAISRFKEHGDFWVTFHLYHNSKKVAQFNLEEVNQDGYFSCRFNECTSLLPKAFEGLMVADFFHEKEIPVSVYVSHVHKKSGAYVAYPASTYAGEKIYQDVHDSHLFTNLFWPGVIENDMIGTSLVAMNPYDMPYQFQVTLFLDDSDVLQTHPIKISKLRYKVLSIHNLFPDYYDQILRANGKVSICVSSQFKMIANIMISNKRTGIVQTIDHLHPYVLY